MFYHEGATRAVITLADEVATLPGGYEITIEARAGLQVQVLVKVRDLCAVAIEPVVVSIGAPRDVVGW